MAVVAIATNLIEFIPRSPLSAKSLQPPSDCITLVADLNPPLNVRSQPFVAPDNIVGKLNTGMRISIEKQEGNWLLLNAPVQGWVYQKLTATSCAESGQIFAQIPQNSTSSAPIDSGQGLLAIATEQYHAGNIDGAVALVKSIPSHSVVYQQATTASVEWPQTWQNAQDQFYSAQHAIREGRWQEVLDKVQAYPDIRFWREKLTPVVREAIKQQQRANQPSKTQTPK